jgi:hypothetical protein
MMKLMNSTVILPKVAASQLDVTAQKEKMVLAKDLLDATLFVIVLATLLLNQQLKLNLKEIENLLVVVVRLICG